ncbi:hypothetical protein BC936DRAFT_146713 [Jimgerdemannia flammicorona]|uniref:Uncharacterized protein n=1 Tax=Jimgerdemannia flammicorona TaxID=994334 RepID=A0A433D6Z9_9FUNG|nr:hypothetical protein BC936DRAFT_146713 [Jimgerdemannia flammicorona]
MTYHRIQIRETVDEGGLLTEFLAEGIRQVVGRVGGDEEDGVANLCHLGGKRAGGGCLADAAFATDEDPVQ